MSTIEGFSDNPLCGEMERRCADMQLVSQAVVTCCDVFEQACEPRPPKAEWFGTGPRQWDSWQLHIVEPLGQQTFDHWALLRPVVWFASTFTDPARQNAVANAGIFGPWLLVKEHRSGWPLCHITECVPVAKEGYPAPVGWNVVEDA